MVKFFKFLRAICSLAPGVAVILGATSSHAYSQHLRRGPNSIWQGQSGGFYIRWTPADITASPSRDRTKVVFSAKLAGRKEYEEFARGESDIPNRCQYSESFKLLSIVGSLMSYQEEVDIFCEMQAHPAYWREYHVVDLNEPATEVELTRLFNQRDLYDALLRDRMVRRTIADEGLVAPATLDELLRLFEERSLSLKPMKSSRQTLSGCTFTFPEEALRQFAFDHLESGGIALRSKLSRTLVHAEALPRNSGLCCPFPNCSEPGSLPRRNVARDFL